MTLAQLRHHVIAWLLCMTLALPALAGQRIWVALAEEGGPYAEAAQALQSELGTGDELVVRHWQGLLGESAAPPDLLVTVGATAFDETLKRLKDKGAAWERVPVLATLLPQHAYELSVGRHEPGRRQVSAALLDQPLKRQLALIRRAMPERRRVGALLGAQSAGVQASLLREARGQGLTLQLQSVAAQDELYAALKRVLDDAEVLLAVPEPGIYNASTLQHILLTTYRARVPMVAFSAAYAKAGAALALYSTPAQVMQRAGEMIAAWQAGRGLPLPQSPREFSVVVNAKVAASLGLALDEAADIQQDLRRQEGLR